jgi:hypothetical protein
MWLAPISPKLTGRPPLLVITVFSAKRRQHTYDLGAPHAAGYLRMQFSALGMRHEARAVERADRVLVRDAGGDDLAAPRPAGHEMRLDQPGGGAQVRLDEAAVELDRRARVGVAPRSTCAASSRAKWFSTRTVAMTGAADQLLEQALVRGAGRSRPAP